MKIGSNLASIISFIISKVFFDQSFLQIFNWIHQIQTQSPNFKARISFHLLDDETDCHAVKKYLDDLPPDRLIYILRYKDYIYKDIKIKNENININTKFKWPPTWPSNSSHPPSMLSTSAYLSPRVLLLTFPPLRFPKSALLWKIKVKCTKQFGFWASLASPTWHACCFWVLDSWVLDQSVLQAGTVVLTGKEVWEPVSKLFDSRLASQLGREI